MNQRGHKDCGECAELPCATFLQMKDPATSDEEHQRMIGIRVIAQGDGQLTTTASPLTMEEITRKSLLYRSGLGFWCVPCPRLQPQL